MPSFPTSPEDLTSPTILPSPSTSQEWWDALKHRPEQLLAWLLDQYRGEATAAERIERLRDAYGAEPRAQRVLTVIADQERKHAGWVGGLLRTRGVDPIVSDKQDRYWKRALPGVQDFETGCAVGAHAERMRLERIEVIAADPDTPEDIRGVFTRILPEERFHERAFRTLAGARALEATRGAHALGRQALGLAP